MGYGGHSHNNNNDTANSSKKKASASSHGHSHHQHDHDHQHDDDELDDAGHGHHHEHRRKNFCGCCHVANETRLICQICLTFTFFVVELVVGHITKSVSMTADAFHMLSDVLAIVVGLTSIMIAKRQTKKNTFGWVRAELLGSLINSVFLVSLCFSILIEAIERLFKKEEIESKHLLLYVGIFGLCINLLGLFVIGHGHHGHTHGGHTHLPAASSERELDVVVVPVAPVETSDTLLSSEPKERLLNAADAPPVESVALIEQANQPANHSHNCNDAAKNRRKSSNEQKQQKCCSILSK